MRVVVLGGCGDMGGHAVRDLLEHTDFQITIADRRLEPARMLAASLGGRGRAIAVDAGDEDALIDVLAGADVAVNCMGPNFLLAAPIARAAIRAPVSLVDICDDWGPVDDILAMDDAAKAAGVTVINGLGWTPGITNLMAKAGAARLDRVDEIRIAWGGGAADSQGLAVVMHVGYAVTGRVPTWLDGRRTEIPARSQPEVVEFPAPLGAVHVSHCGHPEPLTLPRYLAARNVSLKGGLTPNWNNHFAALLDRLGLFGSPSRIQRTSKIIHAVEGVFRLGGVAWSGARVDVIGASGGVGQTLTYTVVDKMGRLTGIPASIGAAMLARGELATTGVFAPEGILDPEQVFAQLARRGVNVQHPAAAAAAA